MEKVYETGLAHRLRKMGLDVKVQIAIEVRDEDGTVLGHFVADLLIEGFLIVEVKAVQAIAAEHEAQLIGYLRATGFEHGALVNFGAPRFWIRKYLLTDEPIA